MCNTCWLGYAEKSRKKAAAKKSAKPKTKPKAPKPARWPIPSPVTCDRPRRSCGHPFGALRTIKALLGHEKLLTTAAYARLAPERLRGVLESTQPDNRQAV
jgi:hypothetical protein